MSQLKEKISEPLWLTDKRRLAKERFQAELLPDRVNHLWKYTNPEIFIPSNNKAGEAKLEISKPPSGGVEVLSLLEGMNKHEDLMKEKFGSLMDAKNLKLSLLNDAFWNNGYFVYLRKNSKPSEPITLMMTMDQPNGFYPVRNIIFLEEGASVQLVEQLSSPNDISADVNVITEIFLCADATLDLINLNMFGDKVNYHLIQRTSLDAGSVLRNTFISLGGKVSKVDSEARLAGKGASVETSGVVLGDNSQHFDHHTTVSHLASHTKSSLDFRVALKDKAKSAYTGNLKISESSLKCEATQENRNLLLSEDAKAESIPELEILTNDVEKCSHGVTMGQIDKDQIYYLMSRGLTRQESEQIIIGGFVEPVLLKVPEHTLISGQVNSMVEQKLNISNV